MNAFLAASAILLAGVSASFNDAASNAAGAANKLGSELSGWSSADGLQGALQIQGDFSPFSSALGELAASAKSLTGDELDVQATSHFGSAVTQVLDGLTQRAADFSAVGAGSIASGDLKALSTNIVDIVNGVIKAGGENSSKWGALSQSVIDLESKINDANKAYSLPALSFNALPTGGASSSSAASSSGASSSAASSGSSAKETSAATSTKGAESSASTAAPMAVKTATSKGGNGTVATGAPAVHNGATGLAIGAGAAAVGVAALLI